MSDIKNGIHHQEQPGAPPAYSAPITTQPGFSQPAAFHSSNTTVVVQAPQAPQTVPTRPKQRTWSTDIFGCFSDMTSCIAVTLCPHFYLFYLSQKLGESCLLPLAMPDCTALVPLRTKIRAENNITGSICEDCCMVCLCSCCVMCQLSREQDYITMNNQQNSSKL
ncbi:cornifelin homolog A-like [Ostrea edulis]|uniref:cornifelin homolog A-like n=1 Tax=Ostrea edulis TaxID=37623 RepID=UPI0024AEB60B|nr:cornifelin homolog A-like [Ostrea edulis]